MMTGHAYSRAVRAHLLTSAALLAMLLSNHEHQNDENQRQKMCSLQALLIDTDCSNVDVLEDTAIRDLRKTISNAMDEERRKSRTGALWINYMDQVSILKMFLYAERTGDWMLHFYCITKMIPYVQAAGHLAYAKSARLSVTNEITCFDNVCK